LRVDGLARHEGSQLFYRVADEAQFGGRDVVVVGGEEPAVAQALRLAQLSGDAKPRSVALLHRRDVFDAPAPLLTQLRALSANGAIRIEVGQVTGLVESDADAGANAKLRAIAVSSADDSVRQIALDVLLVLQGLSPKLGPIADWGLALERKQVVVDAATFSTSVPGIYAVGDVNTYPGKKKLILCGFHEATLTAFAAAERVHEGRKPVLEYTTTSTRLHRLLGV
jgi:thioredoxin reductase (NADPH)